LLLSTLAYSSEKLVGSVVELISIYHCKGEFEQALDEEIKRILELLKRRDQNYVFYSQGNGLELRIYDLQPSACLERIEVASFALDLSCGSNLTILLGTWPSWMQVPEVCP
jgi:hypothetical protein